MRQEFAGKTGLIVGGSSGIGKTVLLERGSETVIIVGKNNPKLRATELELGSFGKVITRNTDISDSVQLDLLLAEVGFHPIGRIGTPEDVAEVVSFLLSGKASWISVQFGTSMVGDGWTRQILTCLTRSRIVSNDDLGHRPLHF